MDPTHDLHLPNALHYQTVKKRDDIDAACGNEAVVKGGRAVSRAANDAYRAETALHRTPHYGIFVRECCIIGRHDGLRLCGMRIAPCRALRYWRFTPHCLFYYTCIGCLLPPRNLTACLPAPSCAHATYPHKRHLASACSITSHTYMHTTARVAS